jgi:hypothetical protein
MAFLTSRHGTGGQCKYNRQGLASLAVAFFSPKIDRRWEGRGWDIAPYQGNDAWILPIPATFVVGRDFIIRVRFVDPNYRKRMAIDVIVDALRADFLVAEIREP